MPSIRGTWTALRLSAAMRRREQQCEHSHVQKITFGREPDYLPKDTHE